MGVCPSPISCGAAACPGHPEAGLTKMAETLYYFRGVWEARTGRPVTESYPQVIHDLFINREFGSLKLLDTDRGPRCALHITRAQDPRPFGPVPWFGTHETV